ncbi:MAG: CRISPR-associated protein Cas6 [Thermus sp.]|uniref:CRISPR system precrRNA processing endoribonuclease RAMP protein Cas6 n=1 Tax=Thermus sp. TaxID=275 RepID=UPI00331CBE99
MLLVAMVLTIEGEPTPKGAQGFLYRLLKKEFPQVHDQGENPFSLALGKGWVRFGFLKEEVYARLAPPLFALEGQKVRMGEEVRVLEAFQEGHPWAGVSIYARLFQKEAGPDLTLRFARPTFFRREGVNYPLPEARLVFGSLIRRFNAFSPVPVPEEVAKGILEKVTVRSFSGKTLPAPAEEKAAGFVGVVSYHLHRGSLEEAQYFQALGRFAFFSGVGARTSLGAGLARPVYAKSLEPQAEGANETA